LSLTGQAFLLLEETMIYARKEMTYIRSWDDMKKYGIDLLTGEACAIVYRGLFDLTQQGLDLVTRTIGACEIKAPSHMNSGAIASLLMPYSMLEAVAVIALFDIEKCQHVVLARTVDGDRLIIGAMHGMLEFEATRLGFKTIHEYLNFSYIKLERLLTYPEQRDGVTVGMSNVHQMSGRIS
jgi:hypothetical protein